VFALQINRKASVTPHITFLVHTVVIQLGPYWYTWDAVTSVILNICFSSTYDAILCVRQIVYMNKNGGF